MRGRIVLIVTLWCAGLLSAAAPARAQDTSPLDRVEVRNLDAWGVEDIDFDDARVRVLPVPGGYIAAEQDDAEAVLVPVSDLTVPGVGIDDSLAAVIADAVTGWMLRARGVDATPQGRPAYALRDGVLTVTLADPGPAPGEAGPYELTSVRVEGLSGDALSEAEALALPVTLTRVAGGLIAPRAGLERITTTIGGLAGGPPLYASALQHAGRALVAAYNAKGYRGVRVEGRNPVDGVFVMAVTEGRISEIRTSATVEGREPVRDGPAYDRLRAGSPVQPGDLIDIEALDRYVYHLGRRPGRRVDLALSPGGAADDVVLDLLIAENDPLLLYAQLSNTGTKETTRWRERAGLIDYSLTGVDDVFTLDYLTGNFDEVNALSASYERPFTDLGRAWWRVFGSVTEYTADEVGLQGNSFTGTTYSAGGEARVNIGQDGPFFLDALAGARFEHTRVDNRLAGTLGEADFVLPYVGLRAERHTDQSSLRAYTGLEWNLPGLSPTGTAEIDELGRPLTDEDFVLARADLSWSFYLEPLMDPGWAQRENPTLAHELAFSLRGLSSLGHRLPPNYALTAGGFFSVRGYPESFSFGDNVIIGSAEYRFHVPRALPPADPGDLFGDPFRWRPQQPLARPDWDLVLRAFLDVAYLDIHDRLSFEDNATLVGSGVGVELSVLRNVSVRVDWGFVLRDEESGSDKADAGDNRLHVLLTVFF